MSSFKDEVRGIQASVTRELAQAERKRQADQAQIARLHEEAAEMFKASVGALRDAQVPTQRFYLETVGKATPERRPQSFGYRTPKPPRVSRPTLYISPKAPTMDGWKMDGRVLLIDGSLRGGQRLPLGKKQRRGAEQYATAALASASLVPCPRPTDRHPLHLQFPAYDCDVASAPVCSLPLPEWCLTNVRGLIERHIRSSST